MKEVKQLSVIDISKLTGVSCPKIYKVLKQHLGYVSNQLIKPMVLKVEKIKTKGRSTLKKCRIGQGSEVVKTCNK